MDTYTKTQTDNLLFLLSKVDKEEGKGLFSGRKIPSKTSDLLNDSGYTKNEDAIALNKHLGRLSLSVIISVF